MQDDFGRDEIASERIFSAWIWTGLAVVMGGLAVARTFVYNDFIHKVVSNVIGGLLVVLGASIFVYTIFSYRRS